MQCPRRQTFIVQLHLVMCLLYVYVICLLFSRFNLFISMHGPVDFFLIVLWVLRPFQEYFTLFKHGIKWLEKITCLRKSEVSVF